MAGSSSFTSAMIPSEPLAYRADVDGLRAVAVLSVMLFHAFPARLPGGFIGVDIFFVISGFLISTIIFKGLAQGNFGFLDFYARRVRRIFPALALVLLSSLAAGWFVLYPDEYRQLGKHVFGGAAFVSNFVLWRESGYFDAAADTKPLLHLWSLGIEEQYYIIFPLFVWLLWKTRRNMLLLVVLACALSFALNLTTIRHDAIRTFYMPQTRIWELLIGSTLAWLILNAPQKADSVEQTALVDAKAWTGALLIVVGLWAISKESYFPGAWALLPTLGAALLIWAGPQALINRRVLASRAMVWVGKISYPLYLWHWVLLSYPRILASETPSALVRAGALVLAIVLAWLTYVLIEKPLRFGAHAKRKTIALALTMTAVATLGMLCYKTEGFSTQRAQWGMSGTDQFAWPYMSNEPCLNKVKTQPGFCIQLGNPDKLTVAVLGDSTANALVPGIAGLTQQHGEGMINIGHGACPPVRGLVPTETWGAKPNCPEIVEDAYRVVLADKNVQTVILGLFTHDMQYWGFKDLPHSADLQARVAKAISLLDSDIQTLRVAGKQVILTYDAVFSPVSSKDCLNRPFSGYLRDRQKCDVTEAQIIDRYPYLTLLEEHYAKRQGVCVLHQSDLLLTNGHLNLLDSQGRAILRDTHHLSIYGSEKMAQHLAQTSCGRRLPW